MRWLKTLWPLLICFGLMHNPLTHFPVTFMVISLFIISYKLLQPGNLTELGFKKFGGRELVIALVAFSAIEFLMDFAVQTMVSRLTDEPADYSSFEFLKGDTAQYFKWLAYMWVSASFGEELLFRAFVFDRLNKLNVNQALLQVPISAVLFCLPHLYQGTTGLIVTFVFGCLFGVLYRCYQNLWINVLVHGLTDTLFLTLSYKGMLNFYSI